MPHSSGKWEALGMCCVTSACVSLATSPPPPDISSFVHKSSSEMDRCFLPCTASEAALPDTV